MRFEPDGSTTTIVDKLDGLPLNTPNDLAIDRQGRIWFSNPWNAGNIDPSEKQVLDHNSILRADPQPDGTWVCKRMTTDTTGTNGLLISPDQRTLYMIQTGAERRELRAYDILSDGSLGRIYRAAPIRRRLPRTAAGYRRHVLRRRRKYRGHGWLLCQRSWSDALHLGPQGPCPGDSPHASGGGLPHQLYIWGP